VFEERDTSVMLKSPPHRVVPLLLVIYGIYMYLSCRVISSVFEKLISKGALQINSNHILYNT